MLYVPIIVDFVFILYSNVLRERLTNKDKNSDFVWTGGGGPRIIPCVWNQFFYYLNMTFKYTLYINMVKF